MAETDENGLKKTPMYEYYLENNIKISDFHGWALPIQFTKLAEEHEAVRDRVGIFDVAHMGEIRITGEHAVEFVNSLITNDATNTKDNQAMYTAITNEEGGTLDDVIFYKHSDEHIIFTPNASNTDKIFDWFTKHNQDNKVKIENASDEIGIIALQGPKAEATLQKLTQADLSEIKPFQFIPEAIVADVQPVVISRTGYTGEDGFELYVPFNQQPEIWKQLLKAGEEFGMKECGLGARDTLRLEAGLALYGNELTEEINPFEGGIGFAVKLGDKKAVDYPGKKALEEYRKQDKQKISRAFELTGKGIAREGMLVKTKDGTEIGYVTSGTHSPTFKKAIGYALIDKAYGKFGAEFFIEVRKRLVPAKQVKKDWLKRKD
ncbi:MAG TPA: glycine cleavage system aminomethyltransferase GcvT [Atopostipes sp.]|nr:glycine cleavage system aminomethyltransferase GcvT [Atopostipes sp.]